MIKKFVIIILLAFFMISAVSASEIDEATFNNHAETQIQEFAEANQIGTVEEISTDDIVEEDVVIHEDNSAPVKSNQVEYNDSNIIYYSENYNEIENNQYNNSYIDALINETLDNDMGNDLNTSIVFPVHTFNYFFKDLEVFIFMKLDLNFETIDVTHNLSKFKEINKFKVLTHEDLIFYNNYYNILTHDVEKIILSIDKLHSKFVFSIDNSIIGSADCFIYNFLDSNFSNFNFFSLSCFQAFSDFVQIFINFNYNGHCFFPSKQSNDKEIKILYFNYLRNSIY